MTKPTTPKTLPVIDSLPQLDEAAVKAEAQEWVDAALAHVDGDEAIAKAAAAIVLQEAAAAEEARKPRDAAAYTIITRYQRKRGANLHGALGVERSRLMVIKRKQEKIKPAPVEDAPNVLPGLALVAARHQARVEYARDHHRDPAVDRLLASGWTNAQIAELIGRDPSRVSHLKHKGEAA